MLDTARLKELRLTDRIKADSHVPQSEIRISIIFYLISYMIASINLSQLLKTFKVLVKL